MSEKPLGVTALSETPPPRCRFSSVAEARPVIILAMFGARRHYIVPRILHEAGLLERLYTDTYAGNKPTLAQLMRSLPNSLIPPLVQRWLARDEPSLPASKVISFDLLGIRYVWARRRATDSAVLRRVYANYAQEFNTKVLARGPLEADVIMGFNGAALELFAWAQSRGLRCVLDQTSPPYPVRDALLDEHVARWPDWQPSVRPSTDQDPLAARERQEWELADLIVTGSSFVAQGIEELGVSSQKCQVIPYGVDPSRFATPDTDFEVRSHLPLRVLFVGEVSVAKGAPYLLEALRRLGRKRVRARFAGRVAVAAEKLASYAHVAQFLGPVPRSEMPDLYSWADVFCLPSLFEGGPLAIYEALMAGLPVVTTENARCVIRDGESGRILPVGDVAALESVLLDYLENPKVLHAHTAGARALRSFIGIDRYRDQLIQAIRP